MYFKINHVDVISRRNKRSEPCLKQSENFDNYIMEKLIEESGCRPPPWNSPSNASICENELKMKNFARQPSSDKVASYYPACRVIDRITYIYQEQELNDNWSADYSNASFFIIHKTHGNSIFNEMIQTKAYTLDDLVGTIGGFIGLFLGYALIQLPDLINNILILFKTRREKLHVANYLND